MKIEFECLDKDGSKMEVEILENIGELIFHSFKGENGATVSLNLKDAKKLKAHINKFIELTEVKNDGK